jgi:hypothetical protein
LVLLIPFQRRGEREDDQRCGLLHCHHRWP